MWLRLPNGRTELIANEDHIKRLLAEGAVEIADPRLEQSEEEPEQTKEPENREIDESDLLAEQQEITQEEARKPKRGKPLA